MICSKCQDNSNSIEMCEYSKRSFTVRRILPVIIELMSLVIDETTNRLFQFQLTGCREDLLD